MNTQYQALRALIQPEHKSQLEKVLFCSQFVGDQWLANPVWCTDFFALHNEADWQLAPFISQDVNDEAVFMQQIRQWRMQQMAIIAARDLLSLDSTEQSCRHISRLADVAITSTQEYALQSTLAQAKYKDKVSLDNVPAFITVGMGKLGGYELNYSSDIDVMFFYDDDNQLIEGVEWPVFFTRVAQLIIKIIGAMTADGFVFRVDVRLRPFGESGALVLSLASAENYYMTHGRDWERYALIKARLITGTEEAKSALSAILRPFVYRRYLDFSALEALRDLKARIVSGHSANTIKDNLKLGRGGIREIEFIFQLLQLTYGGKEPVLRTASLLEAAQATIEKGWIGKDDVEHLLNAYWFLRKAENSLQMIRDQQVHTLPTAEVDQLRLSIAMGYDDYASFLNVLEMHQTRVQQNFDQLLYTTSDSDTQNTVEQGKLLWLSVDNDIAVLTAEKMGYINTDVLIEQLSLLKNASIVKRMSQTALLRLDAFMPVLLHQLVLVDGYEDNVHMVWSRLHIFLRQVALRSTYLVMLTERPEVLNSLIVLMMKSVWIAENISGHPAVLDMLLEPLINDCFVKSSLQATLNDELAHSSDIESQMQVLRKFKLERVMKIACADLNGMLPLMQVSDSLTYLSESLLESSMMLAKQPLIEMYGEPTYINDTEQQLTADMAVIGYGKMGGLELSYQSDLDIVFLHNSLGNKEYTNGDKSIDNTTFFARWVQKTLHYLNTLTSDGRLYEVDMRLRPNGASGTLATRINGFERYLQRDAWLWELQALVRARFVAGNTRLGERFESIRKASICQQRDGLKVKSEVADMRLRMRKELGSKNSRNTANQTYQPIKSQKPQQFQLKHDFGGIADIEFMVQYAVLANAALTPVLADYTDNIRLLEIMGEHGYLNRQDAQSLIVAYQLFRQTLHHRSLQNQDSNITNIDTELADAIDTVSVVWLNTMNE